MRISDWSSDVCSSDLAERAVELSLEDRARAKDLRGPVFFDRGLIDAAAALEFATGRPVLQKFAPERFNRRVFMTPPWPEIYVTDADRRHGLEEAKIGRAHV